MENELDIRLKPALESVSSTKVPLDGEIIFVRDSNDTTNNNIRLGDGSTQIVSLPNFLTLSSGSGSTYNTDLNGTPYGDTSGTTLGSWYAPTSVGSQYQLLMSNGSGAPSWTLPSLETGQTAGLLKFTSSSGWSFDSNTYLTSHQTLYNLTLKLGGTTSETYIPATNDTYEFDVPLASSSQIGIAKVWNVNNSVPDSNSVNNNVFYYHNRLQVNRYSTNGDTVAALLCKDKLYVQDENLAVGGSCSTDVSNGVLYAGENVYYEDYREYTTIDGVNSVIIRCKNKRGYYIHPVRLSSYYIVLKDGVLNGHRMYIQQAESPDDLYPVNYPVYESVNPVTYFITNNRILPTNITLKFECGGEGATTFLSYRGITNVFPILGNNSSSNRPCVVMGSGYSGSASSGTKFLCEDGLWKTVNTYDVASVNNGTNPGLLQVAADGRPRNVFINDTYVDAIPVFYGQIEETSIWTYEDDEEQYSKPSYVEEKNQPYEGHYVNIADVVNGLVRNPILLALLRDELQEIWDKQ